MRPMKLPYLRTRKYRNKAGETWVGYYYEPPRGSGGVPGVIPKPIALGHEMVRKGQKVNNIPPPAVLAKYSEVTGQKVLQPVDGTIGAAYKRWLEWAQDEVKAGRLGKRTLADYERHWEDLKPVFSGGAIDALDQVVLLAYFDKRSSKDRAKREINFLGLLCAWAKPRGIMRAPNPVDRGLRRQLKVQKTQKPPVPAAVYRVVWTCADQLVRDVLDVSYALGTRPSEALLVPMPPEEATHITKYMPKTSKRGRATVEVEITAELQEIIDRRRKANPHSLYLLFDDDGRQLLPQGMVRTRLYKAIKLAKQVCAQLEITWVSFSRQQLRPTAITQTDKEHGRAAARKLAGHTTEQQTADYIRHQVEIAQPAALPAFDADLFRKTQQAIEQLQEKSE